MNYNDLGGTLDAEQGDRSSRGYTWHQIVDNFSRLFVTNLICVLFLVPALTGFMLGSLWNRPQLLLLAGVLGGALAAPSYIAMYDAALMSYRGYPGRWWERYKLVFKREWKGSLVPGMVIGLIAAMGFARGGCVPACVLGAASDSVSVFFRFPVLSRRMVSGIYDGADCVQHAG